MMMYERKTELFAGTPAKLYKEGLGDSIQEKVNSYSTSKMRELEIDVLVDRILNALRLKIPVISELVRVEKKEMRDGKFQFHYEAVFTGEEMAFKLRPTRPPHPKNPEITGFGMSVTQPGASTYYFETTIRVDEYTKFDEYVNQQDRMIREFVDSVGKDFEDFDDKYRPAIQKVVETRKRDLEEFDAL